MTARDKFTAWEVVEGIGKLPLVEVSAHTWNPYFGVEANPQGGKEPAVANRLYDKETGTYEMDEQYTWRISTDISLITNKIKTVTSKSPRVWVWPYGVASDIMLNLVKEYGCEIALTLNEGLVNVAFLDDIPRVLIFDNPSLKRSASQVARVRESQAMRVMYVDLGYVYDKDPAQQKRSTDKLIQRIYDMCTSHVFLQAYVDPQGDGNIRELHFPNRWLPMRVDLFNYISWQLQTQAGVTAYAWVPVLAFGLDASILRVTAQDLKTGRTVINHENYVRLSPWGSEAHKRITEICEDLTKRASSRGILFHDNAFLTDFEDASPGALAAYRAAGLSGNIEQIRNNPQAFER